MDQLIGSTNNPETEQPSATTLTVNIPLLSSLHTLLINSTKSVLVYCCWLCWVDYRPISRPSDAVTVTSFKLVTDDEALKLLMRSQSVSCLQHYYCGSVKKN